MYKLRFLIALTFILPACKPVSVESDTTAIMNAAETKGFAFLPVKRRSALLKRLADSGKADPGQQFAADLIEQYETYALVTCSAKEIDRVENFLAASPSNHLFLREAGSAERSLALLDEYLVAEPTDCDLVGSRTMLAPVAFAIFNTLSNALVLGVEEEEDVQNVEDLFLFVSSFYLSVRGQNSHKKALLERFERFVEGHDVAFEVNLDQQMIRKLDEAFNPCAESATNAAAFRGLKNKYYRGDKNCNHFVLKENAVQYDRLIQNLSEKIELYHRVVYQAIYGDGSNLNLSPRETALVAMVESMTRVDAAIDEQITPNLVSALSGTQYTGFNLPLFLGQDMSGVSAQDIEQAKRMAANPQHLDQFQIFRILGGIGRAIFRGGGALLGGAGRLLKGAAIGTGKLVKGAGKLLFGGNTMGSGLANSGMQSYNPVSFNGQNKIISGVPGSTKLMQSKGFGTCQ